MQVACAVLFSGAFAFQAFCSVLLADITQPDPGEVVFLQRITEYWKDGHIEDAKDQLRKYLSDYPSSPYLNEIRKMLGDVHLQEGSLEQALPYFEKITLHPRVEAKEALFLRRITEYWKEGHLEDAKNQLKAYLSSYPSSNYLSEILAMLGDLYLHEGALKEALACYEKITSDRCEHLTAVHRAETLYQLGRYDDLLLWASIHPYLIGSNQRIHLLLADTHYRKALQELNPDKVQQHASTALEHFSQNKELDKQWKLIVAYLTALKGEKISAAELYLSLSNEWPEKRDECVYHAASLLNVHDPKKAISLLQELGNRSTAFQKEAAFNELCLLYREKRYADFIERENLLAHLVDANFSLHLLFYKASSYFHLEKFDGAAGYFKQYLNSSPSSKEEIRYALQNLFYCGYKIGQPDLIDFALETWKEKFSLDEGYLEGLLASAEVYLKEKNYSAAANRLHEILDRFPSHLINEIALFNYAQVLLALENFEKGKEALESYLNRYPDSPRAKTLWQNLVYASSELLKTSEKGEQDALKANLVTVLQQAIKASDSDDDSIRNFRAHLAQLIFELGQHREALEQAEEYLRLYSNHPSAREMRLIQISCHLNIGSPIESLIDSFEAALHNEQNPDLQSRLHLQLFNAYLILENYESAADHLLSAHQNSNLSIKSENLIWLAEQMQKRNDLSIAKALLEEALCLETQHPLSSPSLHPLSLEEAALQLKDIYLSLEQREKARDLLLQLTHVQNTDNSTSWKFPRKIRFELADLYVSLGQYDQAVNLYDQLIGDAAFSQASFYLRAAILNRAKLQLKSLTEEEKKAGSVKVASILDTLKDLQIARNVESEPVHLEAALEYAAIRSRQVAKEEEQSKRMLFYLEKIKEDFSSGSTNIALDYLHRQEVLPEQATLIGHYLLYISAEIQRLHAEEAEKVNDRELASSLKALVKDTLQQLNKELTAHDHLLRERIVQSLAQIEQPPSQLEHID